MSSKLPPNVVAFPAPVLAARLTREGAVAAIGELFAHGVPTEHIAGLNAQGVDGVTVAADAWVRTLGDLSDAQLLAAVGLHLRCTVGYPRWPMPGDLLQAHRELVAEEARSAPPSPRPAHWSTRRPSGPRERA